MKFITKQEFHLSKTVAATTFFVEKKKIFSLCWNFLNFFSLGELSIISSKRICEFYGFVLNDFWLVFIFFFFFIWVENEFPHIYIQQQSPTNSYMKNTKTEHNERKAVHVQSEPERKKDNFSHIWLLYFFDVVKMRRK